MGWVAGHPQEVPKLGTAFTVVNGSTVSLRINLASCMAAILPTSSEGNVTEVRIGAVICPNSRVSQPVMAICSGMRRSRSFNIVITDKAILSL